MYLGYFGLIEKPFSIAPDPQYLYMSARHKEAMAHLSYGLSQGGCFIVLTGEVGTGKTTLCRNLLGDLPENVDVALILNANINEQELLQTVCDELKISYQESESQKKLLDNINQHLLTTFADNRHTVLIIDEAQLLSRNVLEQIRLLTNLETTKSKLLQIILIGQPELSDLLARNDLRQLSQRVTARYHLGALKRADIEEYVNYRLSVAGCKKPLFSRQALNNIHALTEGIPRKINVLADHSLLSAYANNQQMVDSKTVKKAAKDVFISANNRNSLNRRWLILLLFFGLILLVNMGIWWWLVDAQLDSKTATSSATNNLSQKRQVDIRLSDALPTPPTPTADVNARDTIVTASNDALEATGLHGSEPGQLAIEQNPTSPLSESFRSVSRQAGGAPGMVIISDEFLDGSPEPVDTTIMADKNSNLLEEDTAFTRLLETSADLTGRVAALKELARQWQIKLPEQLLQPVCEVIISQGFRCVNFSSWDRFKKYNRPGLLVVEHQDQLHRVIVQSIIDDTAQIRIGNQYYEVPMVELQRRWVNEGTIFWRPNEVGSRLLSQGDSNRSVPPVRNILNKALATSRLPLLESINNSEFDLDMSQKVFVLQTRFGISADSRIGNETYMLMNELLRPEDTLVLSNRTGLTRIQ